MSKQILLFLLSCLLLPPGAAIAQNMTPQYIGKSDFTWIDNVPNCGGATICWHGLNGTGALNAVSVYSGNGCVFAIDSNHIAHQYNEYPANSWTTHSEYGSVYAITCGGDGHIYALYGPGGGGCINEGYHSLGRWNGSGWDQMTYCFSALSVAGDGGGLMLLIDGNGTLWYTTGFGAGGYQHSPNAPFPVIAAAAINSGGNSYVAIKSDHTIWKFNGTTWTQYSTGLALQVAADANGNVYVIGTDNRAYRWSGSAWQLISGAGKTFLANGGSMQIFAIGTLAGGNTVYRLPDMALRHTRTITGNSTCLGTGCSTVQHTVKAQAGWGTTLGTANSTVVGPTTNVNISGNADVVDPFTCYEMPGTSACNPVTTSTVHCTIAGNLFADTLTGSNSAWYRDYGSVAVTSVSTSRVGGFYVYSVQDNCNPPGSGDINVGPGGNMDPGSQMLDYGRTDTVNTIFAFCYSPDGFQPFSCTPQSITPVNIVARKTTYGLDNTCSKH